MYIHVYSTGVSLDFKTWKEDFEKKTNSWYVQASGKKELLECGKTYYYCNRSGTFTSRSTGVRHLKTQGTSKINSYCTAAMRHTELGITGLPSSVHVREPKIPANERGSAGALGSIVMFQRADGGAKLPRQIPL